MKKIITLLFFVFATLTTYAQEPIKEISVAAAAKENLFMVVKAFGELEPNVFSALHELFLSKHTRLQSQNLTEAQKKDVSKEIDEKLRVTFSANQIAVLQSKAGYYEKLIN